MAMGILFVPACSYYNLTREKPKMEVNLQSFVFKGLKDDVWLFSIFLKVKNKSDGGYPGYKIDLTLNVEGKQLFNTPAFPVSGLNAGEEALVEVPVTIQAFKVGQFLSLILQDGQIEYRIDGNAILLGFSFPFHFLGSLLIPTFTFGSLDFQPDEKIRAKFRLTNRNSLFPFPFGDFKISIFYRERFLFILTSDKNMIIPPLKTVDYSFLFQFQKEEWTIFLLDWLRLKSGPFNKMDLSYELSYGADKISNQLPPFAITESQKNTLDKVLLQLLR